MVIIYSSPRKAKVFRYDVGNISIFTDPEILPFVIYLQVYEYKNNLILRNF